MNARGWFASVVIASTLLLAGCGKSSSGESHADHAEASEGHGGEAGGVAFKEGRGLELPPEVIGALGLVTAEATERSLSAELNLTAHVFATAPRVLASVRLPVEQAGPIEKSSFTGGKLVRIDRSLVAATRLVDLVFELDTATPREVGDFVSLTLAAEPTAVLTVPRSAVLDGATGTFVYVLNGGAYLRTPVKVGARSAEWSEITDGLYEGDVVVVTPVDQLWLAELRLTKGGGHSH